MHFMDIAIAGANAADADATDGDSADDAVV